MKNRIERYLDTTDDLNTPLSDNVFELLVEVVVHLGLQRARHVLSLGLALAYDDEKRAISKYYKS